MFRLPAPAEVAAAGADDVAEEPAAEELVADLLVDAIELPVAEVRKLPEDDDEDGAAVVADEEEETVEEPESELEELEAASRVQIWLVVDWTAASLLVTNCLRYRIGKTYTMCRM